MRLSRKKVEFVQKAKLHNEFRIVLTDTRTGEVKQEAKAYNIILDEGLRRWVRALCSTEVYFYYPKMMVSDSGPVTMRFGGEIQVGTGTGELDRTRTALFAPLGRIETQFFDDRYLDAENGTAKYTQYGTSLVGQFAGSTITEVGLGPQNAAPSTHALIEDAEGSPIGVEVGEFDALTIYAATYIGVSHNYGSNVGMVNGTDGNILLRMVADNACVFGHYYKQGNFYFYPDCYLRLGRNGDPITYNDNSVKDQFATAYLQRGAADLDNFKAVFNFPRFEPAQGNDPAGIWEIGATVRISLAGQCDFGPTGHIPLFRSVMPVPGVFDGYDAEGEEIGTGDGETTTFNLKWSPIVAESDTIYIDGVAKARGTDYTINNATGEIEFMAAPATGAAITADYSLTFIPKDSDHVLDVSFAIQFSDGGSEEEE